MRFPSAQRPFVAKTEARIKRSALWSRVQFDATNPLPFQKIKAVLKQRGSNAPAAKFRVNEHHADPGQLTSVTSRGGRARKRTVPLGEKTAVGLQSEKSPPIVQGLIPAGQSPQRVGKAEISLREAAQFERWFQSNQ